VTFGATDSAKIETLADSQRFVIYSDQYSCIFVYRFSPLVRDICRSGDAANH
jgi:hypothetical protein